MQDRLLAQEKHATDASDAAAASNAHTNPNSPTPTNATEEKIQAIRASLIQRSEVEEETEIASRIAENIKLAKEKKEFPEHFLPRQRLPFDTCSHCQKAQKKAQCPAKPVSQTW